MGQQWGGGNVNGGRFRHFCVSPAAVVVHPPPPPSYNLTLPKVTLTLWRNVGAEAPLAEGWVPLAILADKGDPAAAAAAPAGGLGGALSAYAASLSPSPRRYLTLSPNGLLAIYAPAADGALAAEPLARIHLKDVAALQRALDEATDRWQLVLWLKDAPTSGEAGKAAPDGGGSSAILGFGTEDDMNGWLDSLAGVLAPAGETKERQGPKVLSDVLKVRSRGGKRLPRVPAQGAPTRSAAAAAASTLPVLEAVADATALRGAPSAAPPASLAASAAPAAAVDAGAALEGILGEPLGPAPLLSLAPNYLKPEGEGQSGSAPAARRGSTRVAPLGRRK